MDRSANWRIASLALSVLVLDQLSKLMVLKYLGYAQAKEIIHGFFKFVHWGNTGAAWSLFRGNNLALAFVAAIALAVLFLARRHFAAHPLGRKISLGLIFGGIPRNLTDRPRAQHATDFLYFHVSRRHGPRAAFPALQVAH